MHEHAAALRQLAELEDVQEDRQQRLHQPRAFLEGERRRQRQHGARVDDDLLRIASAREQGHHAIPRREARDAMGHLDDLAGALETQERRGAGRGRIETAALHQVRAVHAGGVVRDAQRTRLEGGRVRLAQPHAVLVSGLVDQDRLHGAAG